MGYTTHKTTWDKEHILAAFSWDQWVYLLNLYNFVVVKLHWFYEAHPGGASTVY